MVILGMCVLVYSTHLGEFKSLRESFQKSNNLQVAKLALR